MDRLKELFKTYRKAIVKGALLCVPLALFSKFGDWAVKLLIADPWEILWVILPSVAVTFICWSLLRKRPFEMSDWRVTAFCCVYCTVFALASTGELFAWKRVPVSSKDAVHNEGSSLFPIRWGDWRYSFAYPPTSASASIVVLLLDEPAKATKEWLRHRDFNLVDSATRGGIGGLALDSIYYGKSDFDKRFCDAIRAFRGTQEQPQRALVTAYEMREVPKLGYERIPEPVADKQPECLRPSEQGHAMGFADIDGLVRGIPLYWERPEQENPALSLRLAGEIVRHRNQAALNQPKDLFLRLLPPPDGAIKTYSSQQDLDAFLAHPGVLSGRILVVGKLSEHDMFRTPFGRFAGAQIHAIAIYDLLNGYSIARCPPVLSAAVIYATCFILSLLGNRRSPLRGLLLGAGAMSACVLVLAVLVMLCLRVWLDAIYAIAAMWLFVPLLLVLRRGQAKTSRMHHP